MADFLGASWRLNICGYRCAAVSGAEVAEISSAGVPAVLCGADLAKQKSSQVIRSTYNCCIRWGREYILIEFKCMFLIDLLK